MFLIPLMPIDTILCLFPVAWTKEHKSEKGKWGAGAAFFLNKKGSSFFAFEEIHWVIETPLVIVINS